MEEGGGKWGLPKGLAAGESDPLEVLNQCPYRRKLSEERRKGDILWAVVVRMSRSQFDKMSISFPLFFMAAS